MSHVPEPGLWIDLFHCDDPRDAVHQAVACLAQGGVIGLATETSYALAASSLRPESIARLRSLAPVDRAPRLTLLLRGPDETADWVAGVPESGRRLARRLWPGPLTLVFPPSLLDGLFGRLPDAVRSVLAAEGSLELGSSAEPFLRDVLELSPAPLVVGVLQEANEPVVMPDLLREWTELDMVIDSGPVRSPGGPTRVRVDDQRWSIEREGVISRRTLAQMSGVILLFVCTGNTCRSPMAEAICKLVLARRLGCAIDELEERGYLALSAGVSAMTGAPAASHAANVLKAMGGTLDAHRSRRVTFDLLRVADHVFAMTADHLDAMLDAVPEAASRSSLLDPAGGDVPDPIGADQETYRQTAQKLEAMIEERITQLGL